MDEVDVQPVDLGDELRQRVHPRLTLRQSYPSPSSARALHHRELHALRLIVTVSFSGQRVASMRVP